MTTLDFHLKMKYLASISHIFYLTDIFLSTVVVHFLFIIAVIVTYLDGPTLSYLNRFEVS